MIRASEVALRRALRKSERGSDVATAIIAAEPAESRRRVNDAFTAVEQRRHDMRRTVFAAELEASTSIMDLGKAWGFSRHWLRSTPRRNGASTEWSRLELTHYPAG